MAPPIPLAVYALLAASLLKASHASSRFIPSVSPEHFVTWRFVFTGGMAVAWLAWHAMRRPAAAGTPSSTGALRAVALAAVAWAMGIYLMIAGYGTYGMNAITLTTSAYMILLGFVVGVGVLREPVSVVQVIGMTLVTLGLTLYLVGGGVIRPGQEHSVN